MDTERSKEMNHSIDGLKDTFRLLVAKGHTPFEAFSMFDAGELWNMAMEEVRERGPMETHADSDSLICLCVSAQQEERDRKDLEEQAIPLWLAGWTSEPQSKDAQVMSWYWRAPAKGKRPLGRRFLSTNQAFMALQRQTQNPKC